MTYLSDWREAEEAAAYAHAMNPDCTLDRDCRADDHITTCARFRAERFEEMKRRHEDSGEQSISERHVRHYRYCGCLGDSHICCVETCPCHSGESEETA